MKTNFFSLAIIVITFICCPTNAQQYSLLDNDMPLEQYLALPIINPQSLPSILPNSKSAKSFNSVELYAPEVGDQGSMGSCVTWSLCYCAGSILAYDKFGNMNEAKRSPAYLFNQYKIYTDETNTCSSTATYMDVIISKAKTEGVCSNSMMPYIQNDCSTQPTSLQKFDAFLNRLSVGRIASVNNDTLYRDALSNGYPIVVELPVYSSFDNMWATNGIWLSNNNVGFRGYHACCVIGFDNSTNRFKVQNSWGTSGGAQGYFYVSYDLVKQNCFSRAYIVSDITKNIYPSIVGDDILCDSSEYYISDTTSGLSYQWTYDIYSPMLMFKPLYIYSNGERAIIKRGIMQDVTINPGIRGDNISSIPTVPYVGTRTILVNVTCNGGQYTMSKDINMLDSLSPYFSCPMTLPTGRTCTFIETNCTDIEGDYLEWTVKRIGAHGNTIIATGTGNSFRFSTFTAGLYKISITNTYSCPTTNFTRTVNFQSLFTQEDSENNNLENSCDIQVYDIYGNIILKENNITNINSITKKLTKGLYFIKTIKDGTTIDEQKLIINN